MSHRESAFSHDFIQVGFVFVLCQLSPEFQLVDQNPLHRLIEMEMSALCCGMQIILGMFLGLGAF